MGSYIRGVVEEELALSTLASKTLIADTWDQVTTEKTLISSIVATWSLSNVTIGQGPIIFGVAHSDYTDAEIEEVIENTGSWNRGDKVSQERAKRLVRQIGVLSQEGGGSGTIGDYQFNEGKPVKTKLNWSLQTGQTLKMWAYNTSELPFSATDPDLLCNGHANLWQR